MITGLQIKRAREHLQENQTQFAGRFGVDQSTIHRWESNGLPDRGTALIAVQAILQEIGPIPDEPAPEPAKAEAAE
jgi:DNA-binding transcriptional regulator YiaG